MDYKYHRILKNELFLLTIKQIETIEKNRIFCHHGIQHLVDVARLAYIISLEKKIEISKDILYATCLLHDIGRAEEYSGGRAHNEAGAQIADIILKECGFSQNESEEICKAISTHGHNGYPDQASELEQILCTADKLSRLCFNCKACDECNWTADKKNESLYY